MASKKIVIDALKQRRQKIAFDANLFKRGLATWPHYEHCAKEYDQLTAEIDRLDERKQVSFLGLVKDGKP